MPEVGLSLFRNFYPQITQMHTDYLHQGNSNGFGFNLRNQWIKVLCLTALPRCASETLAENLPLM